MSFAQRIQQNPGALVVLGLGLIAVALVLIWLNLSSRDEAQSPPATAISEDRPMSDVLVAVRDVPRGRVILAEDIAVRRMEGAAPPGLSPTGRSSQAVWRPPTSAPRRSFSTAI